MDSRFFYQQPRDNGKGAVSSEGFSAAVQPFVRGLLRRGEPIQAEIIKINSGLSRGQLNTL